MRLAPSVSCTLTATASRLAGTAMRVTGTSESDFYDVAGLVAGSRGTTVLESGDMERGIWWAGLSTGLIDDIPTVAELVSRIVTDTEALIDERLPDLTSSNA